MLLRAQLDITSACDGVKAGRPAYFALRHPVIKLGSVLDELHLGVGNTENLLVGVHDPNSVRLSGVCLIEQGQRLQEG